MKAHHNKPSMNRMPLHLNQLGRGSAWRWLWLQVKKGAEKFTKLSQGDKLNSNLTIERVICRLVSSGIASI